MHVLFCSYGNDSIALIRWAHERKLEDVVCLYSDTGWAAASWPARVAQGEALARRYGFRTAQTKSEGMVALVKRKCGWPGAGGQGQFCTSELKVLPALAWLDEHDPEKLATAMTGVRRSESAHRADAPEHVIESERHGGRELWQPLVRHDDVMRNALLARAGFEVLPHRSRECEPCINANIDELRLLSEDRIRLIDITERELGFTAKGKPRVMFRAARRKNAVGIRAVLRWAEAPRARDQMQLFPANKCDSGYCGG
ncbi:phosphoadenosine phosphosulfate reductase family protein [Pseudomonas alliivorans]|nr:phosphoadenosine phosphosulfate reductase family protein [Pseudomonas alliivorans]